MSRTATDRRVANRAAKTPRKAKPVPRKKRRGVRCRCVSAVFRKADWGKPVVERQLFFTRDYTALRIRVACKFTIRCRRDVAAADPCVAVLRPTIGLLTDFPSVTLVTQGVSPMEVPCRGTRCDEGSTNGEVRFDYLAVFQGNVDVRGAVELDFTLGGCDNPRPPGDTWKMVLRIKVSPADGTSVLDEPESDYDGDGTKNRDERGRNSPEWDPGR